MSVQGQSLHFGDVRVVSAIHLIATKSRASRHFGFGPATDGKFARQSRLEAIEAAPPSWAVTLALGENPREVALVNKTTELGNISELTPRIL